MIATKDFTRGGAKTSRLHGTAVAGIIAAAADNGVGFAGVDPFVDLLDARVVEPDGSSTRPPRPGRSAGRSTRARR